MAREPSHAIGRTDHFELSKLSQTASYAQPSLAPQYWPVDALLPSHTPPDPWRPDASAVSTVQSGRSGRWHGMVPRATARACQACRPWLEVRLRLLSAWACHACRLGLKARFRPVSTWAFHACRLGLERRFRPASAWACHTGQPAEGSAASALDACTRQRRGLGEIRSLPIDWQVIAHACQSARNFKPQIGIQF